MWAAHQCGYDEHVDTDFLRRFAVSLRQVGFPLVVFLLCLQAFQILLMPLVG